MMKKHIVLGLILVACFAFLAACSSTPTVATTGVHDQKFTNAVRDESGVQLENLKNRLAVLDTDDSNLLVAAQQDEACTAYNRYQEYESILSQTLSGNFNDSEFKTKVVNSMDVIGKKVATLGYADMKSGKHLACAGRELNEAYVIMEFATIMDSYKAPEGADPKVVRNAYLRAIKPEIQEAIADFNKPQSNRAESNSLEGLVETAQNKWHFTADELGIPPAIQQKLKL